MGILRKIKRAVRGDVALGTAALETLRRGTAAVASRRDRAELQWAADDALLRPPFDGCSRADLLAHFKGRTSPYFLPGFSEAASSQQQQFPEQTRALLAAGERILDHRWPLLGLEEQGFGSEIEWHRDPVSGVTWPRDYHADINLLRGDGSDVRVLWELNRLPHLLTLARAFAVTKDERFSSEFFAQLKSWREQNPPGYGVNWNCAMEVALRAINVTGAVEVFRASAQLNDDNLKSVLAMMDQHGRFIKQNLEFSYIATSNHYLSDVVGLVWLGVMWPELQEATEWRDFGLREMLREMDKQVLADGADFEASTGYHRFVTELFLYTFILCRANAIEIEPRYWNKLQEMLRYIHGYMRPDGQAPLVGDTDGGQVLPICRRSADDHSYLLPIGAVVFNDANLKSPDVIVSEELLWTLGSEAITAYQELPANHENTSGCFSDAGSYIMRHDDLYLLFNASGAGINGRGSHGHNDALSIEVSACGHPFIVDPGSYVYTADLHERHLFRSTAYHSTVEIDGREQNTTDVASPFVIGNEAQPREIVWEPGDDCDRVGGEHRGYKQLPNGVVHRRTITFNKRERFWLVEDEFSGSGEHHLSTRFHLNSGLEVTLLEGGRVSAYDKISGTRLLIGSIDVTENPEFENQFVSNHYYSKMPSVTACWKVSTLVPLKLRWILVPVCAEENYNAAQVLDSFARAQALAC